MGYRIAVCDDAETDARYIASVVSAWGRGVGREARVECFPSAEAFLFHYAEDKAYDVLLLDIEMGGMDGVTLARTLRKASETLEIIFVTGFAEHMAEGYEVSALHYLMKPVAADKLAEALDRAAARLHRAERALLFSEDGECVRVFPREILFAEAFAHTTALSTTRGRLTLGASISEIEATLGEGFVRCHRSYVVNLRHVARVGRAEVTLDDGASVPLSRRLYEAVNRAFIDFYRRM